VTHRGCVATSARSHAPLLDALLTLPRDVPHRQGNLALQHRLAVLGDEHEMVVARADRVGGATVAAHSGGLTSLWAHWYLPPTRPRSYASILELGMLGTGTPAALSAKLDNPERDVICVTGDGAAGFHVMEMQSAAREGAKITTPRRSTRWTGPSRTRGGRPVRRSSASRRTAGRT